MDEARFDGSFEYRLTQSVKEAIWARIEEFNVQSPTEPRPSFYDRVKGTLSGAVAQLRYMNLEGNVVAARGERLYRAVGATGARYVSLRHGDVIALTDEEAKELLELGALELVEPTPEAAEQAA